MSVRDRSTRRNKEKKRTEGFFACSDGRFLDPSSHHREGLVSFPSLVASLRRADLVESRCSSEGSDEAEPVGTTEASAGKHGAR